MSSLTDQTASELLERMRSGDVSAEQIAAACLDRIARHDPAVGAFLRVGGDEALAAAADVDRRRRGGQAVGLLGGLPVAVKDLICVRGQVTTCGSRMLANFVPPYDATVVERLRAADGVLLGKTNLDEFGMGGSTENSAFHPTRNPWDLERIPGGSSGGAAACVAARMAPLSLGTDTGGSIRQPSALCGVVGLKPTYGRVSRFGLVAFASSLDQIGPLARTAEDAALLLEAIAGHDPRDSTSAPAPVPPYSQTVRQPLSGLRLGRVREHYGEGLDEQLAAATEQALDVYRSLGAQIRDVSLPHSRYAIATYYIIAPCEASSNLARYDGAHYGHRTDERQMRADLRQEQRRLEAAGDTAGVDQLDTPLVRLYRQSRAEGFGAEVKRRIMLGTYALSAGYYDAYYLKALKTRRLIRGDYDQAFAEVDLIVGPCTPTAAFPLGAKLNDPLAMYLGDLYTVGTNLAGLAGISIPCGATREGWPIGLHLQAPAFEEDRLLRAAYMFQQVTAWHQRRPDLP
ncbi:MAG: Asp-tRNA(Asn)/Glu-tRNA(Gln) amidotransferase subunit GatA [Pirellulaceae bacterium]|nr:Asp-tRNA(Asn)/Glu-tRNA(Gln) amidotransferase subunit GatA [Pirellulaceae bacterium]